jgi:hypothetical protein
MAAAARGIVVLCIVALWLYGAGAADAAQAGIGNPPAAALEELTTPSGYAHRAHAALTRFVASQLSCGPSGDPWVLAAVVGAVFIINLVAVFAPSPQALCHDRESL